MKYLIIIITSMLIACITDPSQDNINPSISSSSTVNPSISSSSTVNPPISSSSTVNQVTLFIAEVGYVCNGFNIQAVTPQYAFENFLIMYNLCGDMATMSTGTQPRIAQVIVDWMILDLRLEQSHINLIASDMQIYGSSLRFYNAVDGYLRYIYVEPVGDGLGIMKLQKRTFPKKIDTHSTF